MTKSGDTRPMAERCQATAKSGKPCNATVVADGMCAWHAPSWADRRRQWSVRGGLNKSNKQRALAKLPGEMMSLRDVQSLLCGALRDVIAGRLEPGVANASASVARAIAAVSQAGDLEERVAELERAAGLETKEGWMAR